MYCDSSDALISLLSVKEEVTKEKTCFMLL